LQYTNKSAKPAENNVLGWKKNFIPLKIVFPKVFIRNISKFKNYPTLICMYIPTKGILCIIRKEFPLKGRISIEKSLLIQSELNS